NDLPREKLKFIIEEYGRSTIRDSNRCRELLREHAPEHLRETNLLMLVLTEGFVWELTAENVELFAQRLHDEFGTQPEFALWAVESWALALKIISKRNKFNKTNISEITDIDQFNALAKNYGVIRLYNLAAKTAQRRLEKEGKFLAIESITHCLRISEKSENGVFFLRKRDKKSINTLNKRLENYKHSLPNGNNDLAKPIIETEVFANDTNDLVMQKFVAVHLYVETPEAFTGSSVPLLKDEATQDFEDMF
ncbi:MAG: hypothetical protein WCL34_14900, partial [Methylococcaceae bacterium]